MMPLTYLYNIEVSTDRHNMKDYICALRWQIVPRMLRDVSQCDLSTTILGHPISFPVCVAPTALHGIVHHDGEVATARGQ